MISRWRAVGLLAVVAGCVGFGAVAHAEGPPPARVRMATALPEGTPAYDTWKTLETAWRAASTAGGGGPSSELKIYGGGSGDDEMLRRLRANQIQAALLTLDGAARLEPAFGVLRTPLFVRTPRELDAVLAALEPELASRLARQGYTLLGFAPVGWVRVFSVQPLRRAADLQQATIADWTLDPTTADWWKARGYRFAPIALAEVAAALAGGRATAVPATPALALALAWYGPARHLLDLPLVPALGVAIIESAAWEQLDAGARQRVRAAIAGIQATVSSAIPEQEAKTLAEMEKRGLRVDRIGADQEKAWAAEALRLQTAARDGLVDGRVLDLAIAARDRARRGPPEGP